jgi:hypothetical protein
MYGRLDMHVQAKFQSGYGLALYENCNRFQDIGQTPWFNLAKFRKLMGVEEGKYKIFRDFKTRVLDMAVKEVNQYSSLSISPQLRKQNRQVISIQFVIKKPNGVLISQSNDASVTEESSLTTVLKVAFGFSAKQITEATKLYEESYIREKVNFVQASKSFKSGKVKHLARYLLSALRDDYQPAKPNVTTRSSEQLLIEHTSQQQNKSHTDIAKLTAFKRFQDKQLFELFSQLPKRSRSSILKKFEKFLTGIYYDVYLRSELENLLVRDQLCVFLKQSKHVLVKQLMRYEDWLKE